MRIDGARHLVALLVGGLAAACSPPQSTPLAPVQPISPAPPATSAREGAAPVLVESQPMQCRDGYKSHSCDLTAVTPENRKRLEALPKDEALTIGFLAGTTDAGLASVAAIPWVENITLFADQPLDLAPLRQLTKLKRLDVLCPAACLANPDDLGALTNLEVLAMRGGSTRLLDLHTLGKLTKLRELMAVDWNLRGLDALAALPALVTLTLSGAKVDDLKPLGRLPRLTTLSLARVDAPPDDFTWLANLRQLEYLYLDGTAITNLAPLAAMPSLRELSFSSTGVTSVEPLKGLDRLGTLMLADTAVSDLGPLAGLPTLHGLYINHTGVKNLEPVAALPALTTLEARDSKITDLGPLRRAKKLEVLDLDGSQVRSVAPLAACPKLWNLKIRRTPVTDLKPLEKVARLHDLGPPATATAAQLAALKARRPELVIDSP
jgi:Leucine-rich repeat (LRR) protein